MRTSFVLHLNAWYFFLLIILGGGTLQCCSCSILRRKLQEKNVNYHVHPKKSLLNDDRRVTYSSMEYVIPSLEADSSIFHKNFVNLNYHHEFQGLRHEEIDIRNCLVKGDIHDELGQIIGIAKLNSCMEYSGLLVMNNGRSLNMESINTTHFIIYPEDMLKEEWSCGSAVHNDIEENELFELYSRSQEFTDTRVLLDIETQSRIKFLKILIVNDRAMYEIHGKNTHSKSAQLVQRLQVLYDRLSAKFLSLYPASEAYSIQISITGMITFKTKDPWVDNWNGESSLIDPHKLLYYFSEWKSMQIAETKNFPEHSVSHLLSGHDFEGGTVGLANLFAVCKSQSSVAINQIQGFEDETIATIMAHELAHNLGVYHTDTTHRGSLVSSPCGGFIMDANGIRNTQWSKCTVNYLKMFFDGHPTNCIGSNCNYPRKYGTSSLPACLETPPVSVWSIDGEDTICGNGIKEGNEQCDCGSEDCSEIDPCCDGKTCTYIDNDYECSSLEPCCENCKIAPKASLKDAVPCREAISLCDLPEYCDGQSPLCPFDVFEKIGTECYDERLDVFGSCFIRNCNSHMHQCLEYDHLGFDGSCKLVDGNSGDVACGDLYCHKEGSPESECEKVYVDSIPVKVLDGTKCGDEKVCDAMKKSCVHKDELEMPVSLSCSNGVLDADETDIDCGGPRCFPCSPGDNCLRHGDCYNNDCVNSSITGFESEQEVFDDILVEPEEGCTSLKTVESCGTFNGCIWLEEFTRCKRTGEYPPSGDCFTQKKRQSCVNFNRCEWDFSNDRCIEIIGELPQYGICSGEVFLGTSNPPWWKDLIDELRSLLQKNPLLAYTLLACSVCSITICVYACVNCCSNQLFRASEAKRRRERKKRRKARKKQKEQEEFQKTTRKPETKNEKVYSRNKSGNSVGTKRTLANSSEQQTHKEGTTSSRFDKELQHLDLERGIKSQPDVSTSFTSTNKIETAAELPQSTLITS